MVLGRGAGELSAFGGVVHYVSHWSLPPDGGAGHCFPAGQAASGFTFLGGYLAVRRPDARSAPLWPAGAAAAGLLLGLPQQWRGAHFIATRWSAAVCWGAASLVDAAWPRHWRLERI